ncbi:hypothetical protein KM1_007950 [Entamoeba histolytica HM-3:IMSS]|uniref:Two tm domain protein n=3 Tax=Entamoeba TaxID=5758 RepID=A0A175JM78_ENTHI|nr:hypothetical protein KM1_007950 [Entamoeba histolytica HM-3:IMSS]GAT94839.1 two tm domain protein [Entamoeba histolytica]
MENTNSTNELPYLLHAKRMLEKEKENIERRNIIYQNICEEMDAFDALGVGIDCDYKQFCESLNLRYYFF